MAFDYPHLACAWAQCLRIALTGIALTGLTLTTQSFAHTAEQLVYHGRTRLCLHTLLVQAKAAQRQR
jgi:hypothetical protein